MRCSERSSTLVGQLRSFLEVPDNVLAIAQHCDLLNNLDATFFRVVEARGGILIKYVRKEPSIPTDEVLAALEEKGLQVPRLEDEGRFRIISRRSARAVGWTS